MQIVVPVCQVVLLILWSRESISLIAIQCIGLAPIQILDMLSCVMMWVVSNVLEVYVEIHPRPCINILTVRHTH